MGELDTLPVEVLSIIFQHLIIDTTDYQYPNGLDKLFLRSSQDNEPKLHEVKWEQFSPLMDVNRFFYNWVGSIMFQNLLYEPDLLWDYCELNDDSELLVFDVNRSFKSTQFLPKCYYNMCTIFERMLPEMKSLVINELFFDFSLLLGKRWLKQKVEVCATNLRHMQIDIGALEEPYYHDYELNQPLNWKKYTKAGSQDFLAPFVVKNLRDSKAPNKKEFYRLQVLISAITKLIAAQKPGFTCKIVSVSGKFLYLASLLWMFDMKQVLDTVESLHITSDDVNLFDCNFPPELRKMKKLKNLLYKCEYQHYFEHNDDLRSVFNAIEHLESLDQLVIYITQPPEPPKFPSKLTRLYVDDSFIAGRNDPPFGTHLDNIVELSLELSRALYFFDATSEESRFLRMKNLKTLTVKDAVMDNSDLVFSLLQCNPQITSFSVSLVTWDCGSVFRLLLGLDKINIKCLSISCKHLDLPRHMDTNFNFTSKMSKILSKVFPSLKVLLIGAFPSRLSLKQLIQDLAHNYVVKTHNLNKIYIYGHYGSDKISSELAKAAKRKWNSRKRKFKTKGNLENPLTIMFTENEKDLAAVFKREFKKPNVELRDFMTFKYLTPKNDPHTHFYNVKLEIEVNKIKQIFGKLEQTK